MKALRAFSLAVLASLVLFALPLVAGATPPAAAEATSTFEYTQNMKPLGFSERDVPFSSGVFNSDLAFWGNTAIQGTYEGFRIIDISSPANPKEIVNYTDCQEGTTFGNQGDIVVYENILVRSWNSPASSAGRFCDGVLVPAGGEGVHIFDISDPTDRSCSRSSTSRAGRTRTPVSRIRRTTA